MAIAGEGGLGAYFSHPPLTALAVVGFALTVASSLTVGNVSPGVREDRGNRWVLAVFAVVGIAIGILPALTDRYNVLTVGGETVRWMGVALFAAGGALRVWPVFVLGKRFSGLVAIQPDHTLVTSGIYGTIRHPSYLGLLINALGWALAFRSLVGVLLAAALLPVLIARMESEEALLHDQFGERYEAYRARTRRLIPGVY